MNIEGKRFLITGGASLIGSYIAEELLKQSAASILILDNLSLGSLSQIEHLLKDPRVKYSACDVLRLDQLLEHIKDIDGVFHVAGYLTLPLSRDLRKGINVNVDGTLTQAVLKPSSFFPPLFIISNKLFGICTSTGNTRAFRMGISFR